MPIQLGTAVLEHTTVHVVRPAISITPPNIYLVHKRTMTNCRTIVIPVNLGAIDWFDRSIFPMSSNKSEALARGVLFLAICTSLAQSQDFAKATQCGSSDMPSSYIISFTLAILIHARQVKAGENPA